MNKRILVVLFGVLLFLIFPLFLRTIFVMASDESEIQGANISINQAYTNVLAAEKTGANVTQLLANLNVAAELLAQADNAYRSGNINSANTNGGNARLIANQVNAEALTLKNVGIANSQNRFLLTIMFSTTAALIYLVILLTVWRRFKRRYNRRLLSMRPEVANGGA